MADGAVREAAPTRLAAMALSTTAKLFPGIKRATELVLVKGQGSRVTCSGGRDYLDFTSGIGVTSTGHCHPKVVDAVQRQAATASHLQMSVSYHDRMLELVERLEPFTMGLDSFFFANSGGEAIEGALRLARQATGRSGVIAFQGGYHGRTAGALAVTSSSVGYRGADAGPLPYGSVRPASPEPAFATRFFLGPSSRRTPTRTAGSATTSRSRSSTCS